MRSTPPLLPSPSPRLRIVALMSMVFMPGCVTQKPLAAWQDAVMSYVHDAGNGDPHVLRDTVDLRPRNGARPARIRFTRLDIPVAGFPPFQTRVDAEGELVGVHQRGDETWYVFVVGVIQRTPRPPAGIRGIHVCGYRVHDLKSTWVPGSADEDATARYLNATGPEARDPSAIFPGSLDVFDFKADGRSILVEERSSKARWILTLPAVEHRHERPAQTAGAPVSTVPFGACTNTRFAGPR